jgi:hypothetical protein
MITYEKANDDDRVLPEGRALQKHEEVRSVPQEPAQGGGSAKAKRRRPPLTVERLREVLDYDQETGVFVWRIAVSRNKAGATAGYTGPNGYVYIGIGGHQYLAHRLAWLFVYSEWPCKDIDHANRQKSDNRILNLRDVSVAGNAHNRGLHPANKSGVKGVHFNTTHNQWCAQIKLNGKSIHLACSKHKSVVIAARKAAELKYFPEIYKPTGTKRSA